MVLDESQFSWDNVRLATFRMQPLHLLIENANQTVYDEGMGIITKVEGAPEQPS